MAVTLLSPCNLHSTSAPRIEVELQRMHLPETKTTNGNGLPARHTSHLRRLRAPTTPCRLDQQLSQPGARDLANRHQLVVRVSRCRSSTPGSSPDLTARHGQPNNKVDQNGSDSKRRRVIRLTSPKSSFPYPLSRHGMTLRSVSRQY